MSEVETPGSTETPVEEPGQPMPDTSPPEEQPAEPEQPAAPGEGDNGDEDAGGPEE